MTERDLYLPVLDWFKGQMDDELGQPENAVKSSWEDMSFRDLIDRLEDEVEELRYAIEDYDRLVTKRNNRRPFVISEAADVANFAMMIAHKALKDI